MRKLNLRDLEPYKSWRDTLPRFSRREILETMHSLLGNFPFMWLVQRHAQRLLLQKEWPTHHQRGGWPYQIPAERDAPRAMREYMLSLSGTDETMSDWAKYADILLTVYRIRNIKVSNWPEMIDLLCRDDSVAAEKVFEKMLDLCPLGPVVDELRKYDPFLDRSFLPGEAYDIELSITTESGEAVWNLRHNEELVMSSVFETACLRAAWEHHFSDRKETTPTARRGDSNVEST